MRAAESILFTGVALAGIAAGTTAAFHLKGGKYAITYNGTGTGTVDLKIVSPDQATLIPCMTQITAVTGYAVVDLPDGLYKLVIATFTASFVSITRIPGE